ncbi:unknown [Clostridium sp. CAG:288]|jgi:hypothetical protein|nr:unknown [Clostridium sp. CAG:288]
MQPIEIIVIIASVAIVGGVFGTWLYKKVTHKPTGDCACCKSKSNKLIKQYHKKYGKK